MGVMNLYGPQAFTAGDLSWTHSPAFRSSNALVTGWSGTPPTGYPEVWLMEDMMRVTGAGPAGENIIRSNPDASQSGTSGFGIGGLGGLSRGQWDMNPATAGNFTLEWDQEFRTDYWDENEYAQLVFISSDGNHSGNWATTEFGSQTVFIEMNQSSGYDFGWRFYTAGTDDGSGNLVNANSGDHAATFAVANQWRTMKLVVIPSTVSGTLGGNFAKGSATISADGSIALYSKLSSDPSSAYVQEYAWTGLKFVMNPSETSPVAAQYARGISFGEATFAGGFTNIHAYFDAPTVQKQGTFVFGTKGTVTSPRTFLANLDDTTRTVDREGTFYIGGDLVVTGDVIFAATSTAPTTLYDSMVATDDGELVLDSGGSIVFVEGTA